MSTDTADLITDALGFTVAALLIASALLQRAGITTPISPRPTEQRPAVVRASLLIGIGLVLCTASRIPSGHRLVWDAVLLAPGVFLALAGLWTARATRRRR